MLRHDEKMITDKNNLVQLFFNDHFINIVEGSCGFKPEKVKFNFGSCNKNGVISSILGKYRNHPSIAKILKNRCLQSSTIPILSSSWPEEINTILRSLNSQKAPVIDKIPTCEIGV